MNKTCLGVLVSGRGSNMQSIIAAIADGRLKAEIGVVISDNPAAPALEKARDAGIPAFCFARRDYSDKARFESAISECLKVHNVSLVVLAGFMRILSPAFIAEFSGRIMNIHPALLPSFPGLHAQEQAIAYGAKFSGCTVHLVDEGMDTGPIILQAVVPVKEDDSGETLAARILEQEHLLYPQAIGLYLAGRLQITGRVVKIKAEGKEDGNEN